MIRLICAALVLLTTAHAAPIPPVVEPLPIDYFVTPPAYRWPKLSPDGRFYGIVTTKDEVELLLAVDLSTGKATPITKTAESKIANYWWKSDELVLLLLEDRIGNSQFQTFNLRTQQSQTFDLRTQQQPNAFSVYTPDRSIVLLVHLMPDDPENVLISTNESTGLNLLKYNIRTGKTVPLKNHSAYVVIWLPNQQGQPLAGFGRFHEKWFMVLQDKTGSGWRRVELGDKSQPDFLPIAIAPDQHRILGYDYRAGDTVRVAAWNPDDDSMETVWQSAEIDPLPNVAWARGSDEWSYRRAIAYEADLPRYHYLTPEDRALIEVIDTALPHTVNNIVSTTADEAKMIIVAQSDAVVGDLYLFDRSAKRIAKLGSTHARTEPTRLATSRYFSGKTRDGFPLHGRIHLPPSSAGPSPAVLYVTDLHERSHFQYNSFFQLLASRGFAVIQIDHRGVNGYGAKFTEAGNDAVATSMADDLIDGLDELAREGLIDPNRVAIGGENRGGLLAIQALVRHPNRFAAWINFATPMDLNELGEDEFVFGRFSKDEIKARFGNESARRKYLRTLDPLEALPQIKVPSFHYYPRVVKSSSLIRKGDRLEKQLDKLSQTKVFFKGQTVRDIPDYNDYRDKNLREEHKRAYAELLVFLDKHLAAHR
jgi:dipeptidyl aminopeptidase/acylaminoacyl peptidase